MSCQLPYLAGRPEDAGRPKYVEPASCASYCGESDAPNNPCRHAHKPHPKPGTHIVCDYNTKEYYHQPEGMKNAVLQYHKDMAKARYYNP